jgi:hypothetical protein
MIRITPFGGCGLHNPLAKFFRDNGITGVLSQTGFRSTPFSLSANTNHQLIDFLTGKIEIPEWIQPLAYSDPDVCPTEEQGQQIFTGQIALVEMSTPTEYTFEGVLLNINRFEDVILSSLDELGPERKLIGRWKGALRRANEDLRKGLAQDIYHYISKGTPERKNVARFVRDTSSRMLDVDEMTQSLGRLRDRLGIPVAMLLHNFNFMPDGRPVSWPADFKANSAEVARRLNIPTLDLAEVVAKEGVEKVMAPDLRHWNPNHFAALGEKMSDFCTAVLEGGCSTKFPSQASGAECAEAPVAEPEQAPPTPMQTSEPVAELAQAPQIASPSLAATSEPVAVAPRRVVEPRRYDYDPATAGQIPADRGIVFAVIVLGGAWASGSNSDVEDKTASVVAEHPTRALMFDAGVRPRGRETDVFTNLRERGSGSAKETPCAGIADQVIRNLEQRFARTPQMLFFSVSRGGTSLTGRGMTEEDGLLRGTAQHREVMRLVARAREVVAQRDQRLEVAAICLLHGEYEVSHGPSGSVYRRGLSQLQTQYDADIRAVTGQTEPVRVYLTQTNRVAPRSEPEIPVAQLNAKYDNPYVQCVGPTYFAPPEVREGGPPAYVKAVGYRRIGQLFGRFLLDDLWGENRDPLRVEDARWVGPKTIRVRYNRAIGLEEDDARVNISDLGPGCGIDFSDETPWCPTVEAVRMARGRENELDVELTTPSSGGSKRLMIAARVTGEGGVGCLSGARSGIRSKMPFDVDPLDGTELFDWACTEQIVLP